MSRDLWGSTSPSSSSSASYQIREPPRSIVFCKHFDLIAFADVDLTDKFRRVWEKERRSQLSGSNASRPPSYLPCSKYKGQRDCWKLQDWPPSTDFKTAFLNSLTTLVHATLVPNCVRRDGVLNITSHFPSNAIAPDLGPKMYNTGQFYLDSTLKQELHKDFGVISHLIYRKPGEDVYNAAGCAYQVACDFVSPCGAKREFHEQNQPMALKEDVLQLRTMAWFAWLSCARQEKGILEG
ncbi:hypothetical protein L227DRAFT_618034 [Lentinus tigrinus ALCF2SS1-6]|uniref:Uncharacterized protein n=1 Tax=Lentinus tigrinus ALCF2SS1-6 TaxID=1328759 RepID=A0A5C2RKN5_9APHY|nr:hypothetical protein L227DRAFT_618034 [Lentinus tigrinus ALCF2SS1-6]